MRREVLLVRIALGNVARHRRRSLISGAMVALGVAAVIFAGAYVAGLERMIVLGAVENRNGAIQISRAGYRASSDLAPLDLDLPADPALEALALRVPNVRALAPRLVFGATVIRGDASTLVSGLAVDPARDAEVCPLGPASARTLYGADGNPFHLIAGRALRDPAEESIILGVDLAAGLGAALGDTVTLLARTRSGSMDALDLTVVGLYRFDDPLENKHGVVVPLGTAQALLHMPARVTAYVAGVERLEAIEGTARLLEAALAGAPLPMEVATWSELTPYFRDVIELQHDVLRFVMLIVFLLVGAGITNTMLMSVFERTTEVGTLLCLGFTRRAILGLFLVEAAALGALAAAAGAGAGVLAVRWAHHTGIPFQVPAVGRILNHPILEPGDLWAAIAAALAAAVIAGLIPAARAAGLRPVEALTR